MPTPVNFKGFRTLFKPLSKGAGGSEAPPKAPELSAFPDLPIELIYRIFDHAAHSSKITARSLCLVASWILPLARAALYNVAYLESPSQLRSFLLTLGFYENRGLIPTPPGVRIKALLRAPVGPPSRSKEKQHGLSVHRLWIPPNAFLARRPEVIGQIFELCPNLCSLAIPGYYLRPFLRSNLLRAKEAPAAHSNTTSASITQLTLNAAAFRYDWSEYTTSLQGQSFLANLTHLCILENLESTYVPLTHLPNLTHLAVPMSRGPGRFQLTNPFVFANQYLWHDGLVIIAIHISEKLSISESRALNPPTLTLRANEYDARLHVLLLQDGYRLWESAARGHRAIWDAAVEALRKARIQIDGNLEHPIETAQ